MLANGYDQGDQTAPLVDSVHLQYGTDDNVNGSNGSNGNVVLPGVSKLKQHAPVIGMLGSMSIAVNSLTGPAMLDLPATFQRSGIIPTTLCLLFTCALSALCSLHMANTISKVPPNNHDFSQEVEFSQAFRVFWGKRWFVATHIIFFCCVTCLNLSSIVDTAQVVDTFLGHTVEGGSAALNWTPSDGRINWVRWDPSECTAEQLRAGDCIAFGQTKGILLSFGYMITLLIFLPMALMDLKENATWQVCGFVVLLLVSVQFAIEFVASEISFDNVTWWGHAWDTLFGVVLFNFALVIAIPAWLYERHPSVDVPTVIHGSSILSTFLYILVGILGAMSMPNVSDNMLESMMSGTFGTSMQIGASIFAFMIIGLGIPLFSVLTRMNMTGSGLGVSRSVGNSLAVYFPFSTAWLLYQGEAVTQLLSWGGVCFTSLVAFLLPLLLALHTVQVYGDKQGVIEVYFGYVTSQKDQIRALMILLVLAIVSVAAALIGNFVKDVSSVQSGDTSR